MIEMEYGHEMPIWANMYGPLGVEPCAEIETPEVCKVGVDPGRIMQWFGTNGEVQCPIGGENFLLAWSRQHQHPAHTQERVSWIDAGNCFTVDEDEITPNRFDAREICRAIVITQGIAVIESITSDLLVECLDEDGNVLETQRIDGEGADWCRTSVIHPDPAIAALEWRWSLRAHATRVLQAVLPGMSGPLPERSVWGDHIIEPWSDGRHGSMAREKTVLKVIADTNSAISLWCALRGPVDAYRVRIGGRIQGYWQAGGPMGAAIASATRRSL